MKKVAVATLAALAIIGACMDTNKPKELPEIKTEKKIAEEFIANQDPPKEKVVISEKLSLEETVKKYLGNRKLYAFGNYDNVYEISTQVRQFDGPVSASADALRLAKTIQLHEDFNAEYISVSLSKLVPDAYGNKNEEVVLIATFYVQTLYKVAPENIDEINVGIIASEYWISESL